MRSKTCIIIAFIGLLPFLSSCSDFLEERSQNQAYVENVVDLDELLIGEGYWPVRPGYYDLDMADSLGYYWSQIVGTDNFFAYVHLMDDDVSEYLYGNVTTTTERNYIRRKAANLHHWQPDPFLDSENVEIEDANWSTVWSRIAAMNSIIYQVGELRGGEDDQELCDRVEGEARFLRAQYYFWLANLYGQPYRKATASTDLCIPLKTTEDIEDRYFSRATAEEVYGQMVEDLQIATERLRGIEQSTKYRANQAAAFLLLSRIHLFMENYEEAIACADSVLNNNAYELSDFNNYRSGSSIYAESPEVIFTHAPNTMAILHPATYTLGTNTTCSGYTSSDDLMACFEDDDLRLKAFFTVRRSPCSGYRCVKTHDCAESVSDILAIRLPEAYLNKAEAQALLGHDGEAITTIQELRANRFANATTISESGEDLVNFIRDERRRELCFEGHRWFDLRRYAVNSVYPYEKEIQHVSLTQTDGVVSIEGHYVLHPYSQDATAYVLPIPSYAIEFNEGYLTNEVRPAREMIVE